jgi:hypothetical protein
VGWKLLAAVLSVSIAGCNGSLALGTDIIWSTGFESGNWSDWSAAPGTGAAFDLDAGTSTSTMTVSDEQAHSGRYSLKLSNANTSENYNFPMVGAGLYRADNFPVAAFYSAWYFVEEFQPAGVIYTIFAFCDATSGGDAGQPSGGVPADTVKVGLTVLPGAPATLELCQSDAEGCSALPNPPPQVPLNQWFQIEAFLRNAPDASAEVTVWYNGRSIYDLTGALPAVAQQSVCFSVGSLHNEFQPASSTLYIDDVAVSWTRVTPEGIVTLPE